MSESFLCKIRLYFFTQLTERTFDKYPSRYSEEAFLRQGETLLPLYKSITGGRKA